MNPGANDEFGRMRTAYLRFRAALRDPVTGLLAFPLRFDEVRSLLADRQRVGALWVGLGSRRLVEAIYGWEAYDQLVAAAARFLEGLRGTLLPESTILAIHGVHSDAFTLFVPADASGCELDETTIARLAIVLEERLEDRLSRDASGAAPSFGVRVGGALLTDNPFHRFERRVYLALDQARAQAERPRDTEQMSWLAELHRVLRDRDVETLFQPIVDLESGVTIGLEAYARGPENSVFRLPRVMFSVGQEAGYGAELDRMCHRLALEALARAGTRPDLLFLNVTPESFADPAWSAPEFHAALEAAGLTPAQIVLDVSESLLGGAPEDHRNALEPLRARGFRLSLDDIGSGSHSVTLVEKLRPDFLKFDMTLVRGLAEDRLRREVVRSLVRLAERAQARLVIERVETHAERDALLACGARWAQGYLFAGETPLAARGGGPRMDNR